MDGSAIVCRLVLACLLVWASPALAQEATPFRLTFTSKVSDAPFTGRVFVVASKQPIKDGAHKQNWFKPEPLFAEDVKGWRPNTPMVFTPRYALPEHFAKLPAGKYHVQALLDFDRGGQNALSGAGNAYSKALEVELTPGKTLPIELTIDQVVPERKFVEKDNIKLVDIESKLLSAFHKKPMRLRAGVVLPKSYAKELDRRYPIVYEIPGFGGDHHMASIVANRKLPDDAAEMIWVMLDPACRTGHHVFADSANNGPCGQALIEELIPAIEKQFRTIGKPTARLVTGHSSGGWSSLWLQITYSDFFGGTWSTAPDPVDFRDFQKVDIHQPGINIFRDEKGEDRPLGRKAGKPILFYKPFNDLEVVLGRGGQLFSFEAVFSPKDGDGQPMKLWDHTTGAIDPKVAKTWEKYDIRLILERNWQTLGPKLQGKLHIYMGAEDTFYLDGATRLLQKSLKDLGSDAVVEIILGRDHGSLLDQALRDRMAREMTETIKRNH